MPSRKSPAELYIEREKRLRDALELKVPDRVPVVVTMNYFPARYVGNLDIAESYYNYQTWMEATRKTVVELEPDIVAPIAGGAGPALEALSPRLFKWPGGSLGRNVMHQYVEGEPLKASEYKQFLADPGDFTLRVYLPRIWGALESFSNLPSLSSLWGASMLADRSAPFSSPGVVKAFAALAKAGKEQAKYLKAVGGLDEELAGLGFPAMQHGHAAAPFDVVSDHLRGMAGTMLDMYRHPEELKQTCEMIMQQSIETGAATLNARRGNPRRVGSALHRGSDGFMSLKQFETFYWPTLKKIIITLTSMGLVHIPFYEGDWAQRLDYLKDLPKSRTIARFALTDMKKARQALEGHTCIMGGPPHTMMQISSPSEVEDYVKKLIKNCGKNGGLIISTSTGLTHEAKPENVKAMIEAVKKYGRY
jgi:uroporphyrinogen-III decarboxylase